MAVTRKCHVVRVESSPDYLGSKGVSDWTDTAVNRVLQKMAPAERIVSTAPFEAGGYKWLYIFTESFGLGPKGDI